MLREQKWMFVLFAIGSITTIYFLLVSTSINLSSSQTLIIKVALPFTKDKDANSLSSFSDNKDNQLESIADTKEEFKRRSKYPSDDLGELHHKTRFDTNNLRNWMGRWHDRVHESRRKIGSAITTERPVMDLNKYDEGDYMNDSVYDFPPGQIFNQNPTPDPYVEEIVENIQNNDLKVEPSNLGERKVILMMTPAFESRLWWDTPPDYNMTDNDGHMCPETRCLVTYDRSQFIRSDLVFFHGRDVRDIEASSLHTLRQLAGDQIWVWSFMESPVNLFYQPEPYDGLFDWTATYKRQSDFWTPYNKIVHIKKRRKHFVPGIAKTKSKLVAVLQSSCDDFRMGLVRQMKKYINVDVYGQCAEKFYDSDFLPPCERDSDDCKQTLSKYKFILAIENSFCDEYVTEKYYKNGLLQGIVPIVLITPKFVNKRKYFIPGSYINMLDFSSIKKLTDYLHFLNKNDTAYMEYFKWKSKYKIKTGPHRVCMVCKKLWEMDKKRKRFVHSNRLVLSEFWSTKSCEVWDDEPPRIFTKFLYDNDHENKDDETNNNENK